MTLSDQTVNFLGERLNGAGIGTATVVDDAFDTPTVSSLQFNLNDFWNLVERDEDLHEELQSFGISAQSEYDIDDDAVARLWSRREEDCQLIDHANRTLFESVRPAFEDVDRIANYLHDLGLEVERVGANYSGTPPSADLVFMDYYLGDPSDPTSSELAARRAREIYDAAGEGEGKPFIILMSSFPNVSSHADMFREESRLLGGLFDFVSKDDLNDPTRFALRVANWASNMPLRHKIQDFVENLDSTLSEKTQEFMRKTRSLTIEDYAFVQALSLQDDGHPLGDYIQWLLSSLLVNKVLEENHRFADSKNQINRMSFNSQPLSHLFPSTHLAEIYSIAIAEQGLEEIGRHPRISADETGDTTGADLNNAGDDTSLGESTTPQEQLPLLRLGDLLVNNDGRRVYMIATPDCDLQFAPGTNRVLNEKESVLLIPGQLRPLRESIRRDQIQTELYFHNDEQHRITWDRKKIITVQIGKFLEWCSRQGYSRPARIRLPYAVKIQQEVITGFSRVGMPVAPPLHDFVAVEIHYEGQDESWEQLGQPLDEGVTVIHERNGESSFVVTAAALNDLLERLKILIESYSEYVRASQGPRKQHMTNKLNKLKQCAEEPVNLMPMLERRRELPEPDKTRQLVGDTIVLHRFSDFPRQCRNNHVVCLNIVYD